MTKFDFDIVESVYQKFNGKYSKRQIEDVLSSSVSYMHHLMKYTDAISVKIPYIGKFVVNKYRMNIRLSRLRNREKREPLSKYTKLEKETLEEKLDSISKGTDDVVRSCPVTKNIRAWSYNILSGHSFEYIQDFQNNLYRK